MKEDIHILASANIPTGFGDFQMKVFGVDDNEYSPHIALISKELNISNPVLVRVHSECITGDLFWSKRCDCGQQLNESMRRISEEGGVLVYLRQEGRGIGIINKLKAYNLQDNGLDTAEANIALGFPIDQREFNVAIKILNELGITRIKLLTNNPEKVSAMNTTTIDVVTREKIIIPPCSDNLRYLRTKQNEMGHMLDMDVGEKAKV